MSEYHDSYNKLLGNNIALSIIKYLCFTGKEMTGREVAGSIGYSPQAVLDSLNMMEKLALIESKRAGRARLYKVNKSHWFVAHALVPLWEKIDEWQRALGKYYAHRLKPKPVSIIMFGSFARGEENFESDLDLLFVYKDTQAKPDLLDRLLSLNSDILTLYGVHSSPKFVSVSELRRSIKEKKGFMRNIFIEGKTIYGLTPSEVLSYDCKKD
ncbi:MAG: nucleotidyltransferase domain-containing protein [bacterium]